MTSVERGLDRRLSDAERRTLARCEATIRKGKQTFMDVGNALALVRDRKLYREGYRSFAQYCEIVHGIRSARARQLIGATETVTAVTLSGGVPTPTTERQVRALAPVRDEPELAREAWSAAVADADGGQPTSEQVARAVAKVKPEPPPLAGLLAALERRPPPPEAGHWLGSRLMRAVAMLNGIIREEGGANRLAWEVHDARAAGDTPWLSGTDRALADLADSLGTLRRIVTDEQARRSAMKPGSRVAEP